LIFSEY